MKAILLASSIVLATACVGAVAVVAAVTVAQAAVVVAAAMNSVDPASPHVLAVPKLDVSCDCARVIRLSMR